MKRNLLLPILVLFTASVCGQTKFIATGKIEFEKQVNMHKLMGNNFWELEQKKVLPVYRTIYFDLLFNANESLYQPGKEIEDKYKGWGDVTSANITYNQWQKKEVTQLKQVFENKYLVQDSVLPIAWKITGETRQIAGFECRKAIGKFNDSLYIIAFFSPEILPPGGPEGFAGLPGMILGVAFPRMYTTWFATKVYLLPDQPMATIKPPANGKKTNRNNLISEMKKVFARWGEDPSAQQMLWQLLF